MTLRTLDMVRSELSAGPRSTEDEEEAGSERAFRRLPQAIVTREHVPGQMLSERALMRRLRDASAISKTRSRGYYRWVHGWHRLYQRARQRPKVHVRPRRHIETIAAQYGDAAVTPVMMDIQSGREILASVLLLPSEDGVQ